MAKNLPAMQETQVRSLNWEDPLEKGMAAHSSILAWRILWTEEPDRLPSMELQRVGQNHETNAQMYRTSELEVAFVMKNLSPERG